MRPQSGTTLRNDLAAVANEYDTTRAAAMFIGLSVAPIFPVQEADATYPIICRENFKKLDDTGRAETGRYNRVEGEFASGSYSCEEHGLEAPLSDRRARRYRTWLDFEEANTRMLRHKVLLPQEKRIADLTLNSVSFTTNAPTTVWSDSANAVPLDDLATGCEALEDNCGIPRSEFSLIIPRADFRELTSCTQVINKVQYTWQGQGGVIPGQIPASAVAGILEIREVMKCGVGYDAAPQGETESNTQIWTAGMVMLAVLARAGDDLEMPALARTMLWVPDSAENLVVETYRDETVRGDVLRCRQDTDEVLTAEADLLGYKLST